MGLREDVQAQLDAAQAAMAIVNRIGDDTFPFGTIMRFAANGNNSKWHVMKTGEEYWIKVGSNFVSGSPAGQSLANWIFDFELLPIGYFEAYPLTPSEAPFYASSD